MLPNTIVQVFPRIHFPPSKKVDMLSATTGRVFPGHVHPVNHFPPLKKCSCFQVLLAESSQDMSIREIISHLHKNMRCFDTLLERSSRYNSFWEITFHIQKNLKCFEALQDMLSNTTGQAFSKHILVGQVFLGNHNPPSKIHEML